VLARQSAAAVGVGTCWPWETAATLPCARRRQALRPPRGRKGRGHIVAAPRTACFSIDDSNLGRISHTLFREEPFAIADGRFFNRPDVLPVTQPTVSNLWRNDCRHCLKSLQTESTCKFRAQLFHPVCVKSENDIVQSTDQSRLFHSLYVEITIMIVNFCLKVFVLPPSLVTNVCPHIGRHGTWCQLHSLCIVSDIMS